MKPLKAALISLVLTTFIVLGCSYTKNIRTHMTHAFSDLALEKMPSVVYIVIKKTKKIESEDTKVGSGIIISKNGYVVTNHHVVRDEEEVEITAYDGEEYKAKVVGRDVKTDLALLKIESKNDFVPFEIGDSDKSRVGEWVMAIGGPFGFLNSVSVGIISGKDRVLGAGVYDSFIQTDASINPGNSGGPLINVNGEVIGINSMILTKDGKLVNIGVGLAIPINMAMAVVKQLKENGKVTRARLGVIIRKIDSKLKKEYKLTSREGVFVEEVYIDSPAEKAGLKKGDIIICFRGKKIKQVQRLSFEVAMSPIGKEIEATIIRESKEKVIKIILEVLDPGEAVSVSDMERKFGFTTAPITPQSAEYLSKLHRTTIVEGVVVAAVVVNSPAYKAGLRRNDIILTIDDEEIKSPKDYGVIMLKLSARKMISMKALKKGVEKNIVIKRN